MTPIGGASLVLDLVFTNEEGMVSNLEYLPGLGSSDHVVLRFSLVCYSLAGAHLSNLVHTDYETLASKIRLYDWVQLK